MTQVPERLLSGLNDEQRVAVCTLDGPLLVVAGPGSGKTRVLTHRAAALVATGVPSRSVLALTFTNKAADEMRSRITGLVSDEDASSMWTSTFHSFCLRLLRSAPGPAGLPASFMVVDARDSLRLMRAAVIENGGALDEVSSMASRISFEKNHMRSVEDLDLSSQSQRFMASVWASYTQHLETIGGADFDDLLLRALRALDDVQVLERVRSRFQRVLVDEWQDTNQVQYEIVARIAKLSRQLAVVGDAQQAIYAWRGSSPEVMEAFTSDFPEAKVVELGRNYRSTPQILEVAQRVVDRSPSRFGARLWTENPPGDPVRVYEAEDTDDEAFWVVNEVIRSSGSAAVLVRTNAQTRAFEQELSSRGVPYQVVGATRFYDRAEVRDMMAYLKVLVNPSDSISLARAAATPRRGVGSKTLELFTQVCTENDLAPGVAIFDANVLGLLPARAASALRAFGDDLQTVAAAAASGGVVAAVDTIAVDVGVQPFYEAKDPQRAENIASLREAAATFTSQAQASGISQLSAFLELAALVSAADTAETQRVSLITAHAAKGREFDHVFVVGVERDLFPHRLASSPSEKVEERRLFFVAVTRPRKSLTVTHRRRRRSFTGMWENASPSMFLRDVEGIGVSMLHAAVPTRFDSRSSFLPPPSPERSVPLPQVPVSPQPRRSPRPAKEFDVIVQGTRVSHPVFGEGLVLEREDSTVTIRFADRSRRLLLEWSPLTVLN